MCQFGLLYNHHFIVTTNYVKQGRTNNGKELEVVEFSGPMDASKVRVVSLLRNLTDYGDLYKINYAEGEAFDSGKSQYKISCRNFLQQTLKMSRKYFFKKKTYFNSR